MKVFLLLALLVAPLRLYADTGADFESDAKPLIARQPGLLAYIHSHYEIKETGLARVPASGDAPAQPPFIFSARKKGSSGPFYLRLLIQPGPPGHILKVADIRKLPPGEAPPSEETASAPPPSAPENPPATSSPAPSNPPPVETSPATQPIGSPSVPTTSDTPSGPVKNKID